MRLRKLGVISVEEEKRKHYEIEVHVPKFEKLTEALSVKKKNPLIDFYKYNGERKVEKCVVCGDEFIKMGNKITCCDSCSAENRRRNNQKYIA